MAPTLISVLVRERYLGTLLQRGPKGFEAFDARDQSLGIYPTTDAAVRALVEAVASTPEATTS